MNTHQNPLLEIPSRGLPKHVGIIGAGTIGPDIGYYLKSALPDLELTLVDINQGSLDAALGRIQTYAQKGVKRGKLTDRQAEQVTRNLNATLDYDDLAGCDWVLEAATENLELKRNIFKQIESIVQPDTVITSNTSALPAERMFGALQHPERATVTHFFAPAFQNLAVEVIDWSGVDPELVRYLRWFFCHTGKVPLLTTDVICFMLDRIFDNWCNEAAWLLEAGTTAEVDSVATEFVHAGPFFVLNLANGNPIITETNTLQMNEEGAHYRPAPIFKSVNTWLTTPPGKRHQVSDETKAIIRDRMLGILFSQSVDIVDRGIGLKSDLNLGCRVALGFKSGPLDLMAEQGDEETGRILARFARDRAGMPMPQQALPEYGNFYRHLLVDDLDGVKVITLRRPDALNALDDRMTDEIKAVIESFEDDPATEGFVITGYGPRAFCAGADIGRFPEVLGDAEQAAEYSRDCSRLLRHLDQMQKPVVAALNGFALGGGLELAIRCHGIVAMRSSFLQTPEITLGIAPGIGAMVVPFRKWPSAAAVFNDMLLNATRLKAEKAHELGMIDALEDDYPSLIQRAVQRVRELKGAVSPIQDAPVTLGSVEPDQAFAETGDKPTLSAEIAAIIAQSVEQAAAAESLEAALEIGYRGFAATACTAAAVEGIQAFQQRRKPDFSKTG